MTEENYKYRTSPLLLRNQFNGSGKFKVPNIPKFQSKEDDFNDLRLIGFDKISLEGSNNLDRMVHFFLYDYKFDRVWNDPETDLEKLKRYRAVLSPDFSMYTEMHPIMQLYNTFRNRWVGAYYASKGIRVIPTVSWGDENTFEFCFDGIEKSSAVAVSTYMVSEHNNHSDQKEFFLKGYNEMLKKVEPEKIICYNEPFPEMQGDIVFVDYELSSWRHMDDDNKKSYAVTKTGYITFSDFDLKGMGSARGGKWRPSKSDDERLIGEPDEIKETWAKTKNGGYRRSTKIGQDGNSILERHWTDHETPWAHSDPHDHIINWDEGFPRFEKPHINYPDGAPEFKNYEELKNMSEILDANTLEERRFKTISDFKWCMRQGGEVQFFWNGKFFNVTHRQSGEIGISESRKQETEKLCKDADEVLEYMVDGVRLRDIITEVEVSDRTI